METSIPRPSSSPRSSVLQASVEGWPALARPDDPPHDCFDPDPFLQDHPGVRDYFRQVVLPARDFCPRQYSGRRARRRRTKGREPPADCRQDEPHLLLHQAAACLRRTPADVEGAVACVINEDLRRFAQRQWPSLEWEDIAGDAYLLITRKGKLKTLHADTTAAGLRTFLHRISCGIKCNWCKALRRRKQREQTHFLELQQGLDAELYPTCASRALDEVQEAQLQIDRLRAEMALKPGSKEEGFLTHYLNGLTDGQIAKALGIALGGVYVLRSRVLTKLRAAAGASD